MVPEFLKTLLIIFGLSATVVFVLHKVRVPSVVGFLIAGVFLGPHGFGFIQEIQEVELLAEIGRLTSSPIPLLRSGR